MSKKVLINRDYLAVLAQLKLEMDENTNSEQTVINRMTDQERQRLMSDPRNKYVVSDGWIHDKQCDKVKGISSELLEFQEEYQSKYRQCPECALKAYIRAGAEDMRNYEKYIEFFEKHEIYGKAIKSIYLNHNCNTRLDNGVLSIREREDSWKIIDQGSDTGVKLMHNNYDMNGDGSRSFKEGYHVQIERTSFKKALECIFRYDYSLNPRRHISDFSDAVEKRAGKKYKKFSFIQKLRIRIRRFVMKQYGLNEEIHLGGFKSAEKFGYPKDTQFCAYIYETRFGDRYWMLGSYSAQQKMFYASFKGKTMNIKQENVVAWKLMNDETFMI